VSATTLLCGRVSQCLPPPGRFFFPSRVETVMASHQTVPLFSRIAFVLGCFAPRHPCQALAFPLTGFISFLLRVGDPSLFYYEHFPFPENRSLKGRRRSFSKRVMDCCCADLVTRCKPRFSGPVPCLVRRSVLPSPLGQLAAAAFCPGGRRYSPRAFNL